MKNPLLSPRAFQILLWTAAFFAKRPRFNGTTRLLMGAMAHLTLLLKRGQPQEFLPAIAEEWQRMFPSRKMNPIRKITDNTVYAEVCVQCPLAGTGNVDACYRLMAYDRKLLEYISGEFVVLKSQAVKRIPVCQVAIRKAGTDMRDLTPAHKKSSNKIERKL